jgi:3-deoxy-D-manno-octulosonate 8-phosphate phosphatase (KDO 8-P phosphatase)
VPTPPPTPDLITLLALDVDGVLTDGSIFVDDHGHETKRFNVRDGFGLRLWQKMGFTVAIVTGRTGRAVQHRMADLGISAVIQGSENKSEALDDLVAQTCTPARQIAFLGDDWPDLPILTRVGYPMAVADADPRVAAVASYVTTRPGGHGAAREAVEHLLAQKGLLDKALALYHEPHG